MSIWCVFQPPQLIPKPHKKKGHRNFMHVFEREFSKYLKLCAQLYLEENLASKFEDRPRFLLFSIVNCFVILYQDETCPFHLLTFLSCERKRHEHWGPCDKSASLQSSLSLLWREWDIPALSRPNFLFILRLWPFFSVSHSGRPWRWIHLYFLQEQLSLCTVLFLLGKNRAPCEARSSQLAVLKLFWM